MSDYTHADIVSDLAWVERRIREMSNDGGWAQTVDKYQLCADELRALLESEGGGQ